MIVSAVLVTHDGERWLPQVLQGLATQTRPVDRVVAVDTGSTDGTLDLLRPVIGESRTVTMPGGTGFGDAVRAGLEHLGERQVGADEWIWILHDDSSPAPDALEHLVREAAARPDADVLGPKLREWPSLRRLLELGVTISGTGRRETGLERGEYDQGQHDDVRRVLAVNTAGMLVRRDVLEELEGFDAALPVFGNDLDFGWRAAGAGHTTVVVPSAVVFHAEAAHRGLRTTALTGRHTHYQQRRAALIVLLANIESRRLLWTTIRLFFGSLLRVVGLLCTRAVGQALDELAALLNIYTRPGAVRAARKRRRSVRGGSAEEVDALRPPWWLPYRHGLDFAQDFVGALVGQAQDVAERRRAAKEEAEGPAVGRGVSARAGAGAGGGSGGSDDDEDMYADSGFVVRFLTNPVAVTLALFVVVAVVAARSAFGDVVGGALSPVPAGGTSDWWRLHLETRHPLGTGTDVPAPAYVAVFALAGLVTGGSAVAVMSLLMVLAVPFALWGAWRFLRVVGRLVDPAGLNRWVLLWASTTYALLPATSGAWGQGRFGTVALAALLPWLAHAALGFAEPEPERRWRAGWRAGLLLALGTAFVPGVWLFGLLAAAIVVAAGFAIAPTLLRDRSAWGPPALALGLVPVLLLPWIIGIVSTGSFAGFFLEAGRLPVAAVDFQDLLSGRLSALGAPGWFGLTVFVLAVAAIAPRRTRIPVTIGWVVALAAALVVAALGAVTLDLAATSTPPSLGFFVVVIQGVFLTAATLAAGSVARRLADGPHPLWERAVAGAVAAAAVMVPVAGLGWWVAADNAFGSDEVESVPAYMAQSSQDGAEHGVLVVRGSVESGLTYRVRRGDGVTVGEDEILGLADEDVRLTELVQVLASAPTAEQVEQLAASGIEYVVLPGPVDGRVSGGLDAVDGLVQASAGDRDTRAWRVDHTPDASGVSSDTSPVRVLLVLAQGVVLLVSLVAAGPSVISVRRRA